MPRYERSTNVDAPADALFSYLSDIRNLPNYFDRMTSAEPGDGRAVRVTANLDGREERGEAWFEVDQNAKTLAWGAEGPNDYHGELDVSENARNSRVVVRIFTKIEDQRIEQGIDKTLANIKRLVEQPSLTSVMGSDAVDSQSPG